MKYIFYIIPLLLSFSFLCNAQKDSSFHLVNTIRGDIVDFTVDNLDNIYILTSRNQVKKLNPGGDSMAVFNDVRKFGQASLIDVSNPLKVLLYYKDFTTLVILDRVLNIRNSIDLRKQGILQARAIGPSYDNQVWVYDEWEGKLKKINEDGKLALETPDFRLLFTPSLTPLKLFDENKYVYLYDSLLGVYVFDYFGALKNTIKISHWQNFRVSGKYIFGSSGGRLYRYEISSFRLDEWAMPAELLQSKSFNFTDTRLYALKNGMIEVYSIW
ncbi:MAG TPA: hypothetical protein VLJ68_08150 [Chitinophagaceae bacterium]|nr:hypothetical protein [Chitinophagaceae bacterium]